MDVKLRIYIIFNIFNIEIVPRLKHLSHRYVTGVISKLFYYSFIPVRIMAAQSCVTPVE